MHSSVFPFSFRTLHGALTFLSCALFCAAADRVAPPTPEQTKVAIAQSLNDFLTFNSDPAQHESFWADDLIYMSAAGLVKTKSEIMKGMADSAKSAAPKPNPPAANYSAEDILIRPYGTTAALTFRLVAKYPDGTRVTYRNSGTLLFRQAKWQVITWQATREPAPAK